MDTLERRFSSIIIKYETSDEDIIVKMDEFGCYEGRFTKVDTVLLSGFFSKRWFGVDCNWTKRNSNDNSTAGYSINYIIVLEQNKYLRISSSYFSKDKNELLSFENDLLNLICKIKISTR